MTKRHTQKYKAQGSSLDFYGLGIAPKIMSILAKLKFENPTPIQHKAVPIALEGKDLIGIAQTGTGKTMAFVIPIIQNLASNKGTALILVPTRELAAQVRESVEKIAGPFGMKSIVLIGGAPIGRQIKSLENNPRIIIATPGRLNDLIRQRKVRLNQVGIFVLDEADRMLDMGFAPQIDEVMKTLPKKRQTMLFSATMPSVIVTMATKYMQTPLQVEIAPPGTSAEDVSHELFIVNHGKKKDVLEKLLTQYKGSILLFCRTRAGTKKIARFVRSLGHRAAEIHSDRSLSQRKEAMEGFRIGKYRVLAATDIAARGIDVQGIELVINYDLPDDADNYVHRIGRTGRAGEHGHAITLATPDQRAGVRNIERLMKMALPISEDQENSRQEFSKPKQVFSAHRSRGRGSRTVRMRRRR